MGFFIYCISVDESLTPFIKELYNDIGFSLLNLRGEKLTRDNADKLGITSGMNERLFVEKNDLYGVPDNADVLFKNQFAEAIADSQSLQDNNNFLIYEGCNVYPWNTDVHFYLKDVFIPVKHAGASVDQVIDGVKEIGVINEFGESYNHIDSPEKAGQLYNTLVRAVNDAYKES